MDGSNIINEIQNLLGRRLLDIIQRLDGHRTDNIVEELEQVLDMIQQLSEYSDVTQVILLVQDAITSVRSSHVQPCAQHRSTSSDPQYHSGLRGRPRIEIPEEILRYYISLGFKVTMIASLTGASAKTVTRRLHDVGIRIRDTYSHLSEEQLNLKVSEILRNFPNIGAKSLHGHLMSQGHRVQQWRVRQALRAVDPIGVLLRRLFLRTIHRRHYSVRAPQALWHIDGNHKLIRWRLVIHGGIDGYSRMVVFLRISNNNRAETVLEAFKVACQDTGLPERVRSDKGGENILVADFMLCNRGPGSFIAGRSVHNQRIERFWREMWCGSICLYYHLFLDLEEQGLLDPLNETHLLALHYVFIPRIQRHLDQFVMAFNNRPIRTEHDQTPKQMWISGRVQDHQSGSCDVVGDLAHYGVDDEGPPPSHAEQTVVVPEANCPADIMAVLQTVDPLRESNQMGVDIYTHLLTVLHH